MPAQQTSEIRLNQIDDASDMRPALTWTSNDSVRCHSLTPDLDVRLLIGASPHCDIRLVGCPVPVVGYVEWKNSGEVHGEGIFRLHVLTDVPIVQVDSVPVRIHELAIGETISVGSHAVNFTLATESDFPEPDAEVISMADSGSEHKIALATLSITSGIQTACTRIAEIRETRIQAKIERPPVRKVGRPAGIRLGALLHATGQEQVEQQDLRRAA